MSKTFLEHCVQYSVVTLNGFEKEILNLSGADTAFTFATTTEEDFLRESLEFVKESWELFTHKPSVPVETFKFSFVTARRFKLLILYAKSHDLEYFFDKMKEPEQNETRNRRRRTISQDEMVTSSGSSSSLSPPIIPPVPTDLAPFKTLLLRQCHALYLQLIPANTAIIVDVDPTKPGFKVTCPIDGCGQIIAPYFGYHKKKYQVIPSSVKRHITRKHIIIEEEDEMIE